MQFYEPQEETYTQWHNPLQVEQYVDLHVGDSPRPTRYRFAPGQKRQLPSRFDHAIHRVHNGVIVGGLAPRLVRVGSTDRLDDALKPEGWQEEAASEAAAPAEEPAASRPRRRSGS